MNLIDINNLIIDIYKHVSNFFVFSEPQTGFRIAFNMFDTDGNQRVDKKEFQVVCFILSIFKII